MRFSLRQVLAEGQRVAGDARVQPVLMGLQLALTELWRSYGVEPDAVIGHSMGEVTAAVVAGALSPAEGLRVIATRSRLMSRLAGEGAVALLEMDAEAAEKLLADFPGVSLAGYLSPRQTVVAGSVEQVDAVIAAVSAQERFARRVNMEVASHTALMDPILPELRSALADLTPKAPMIPFISTVAVAVAVADAAVTPTLDADYWVANVRQPVRLHQAIATAAEQHATFIEISPHPTLTHAVTETLESIHHHSIGTLSRKADDTVSFHSNLNSTYVVRPPELPHLPEPHPVLPSTPWHHTQHWINAENFVKAAEPAPRPGTLLGQHIPVGTTPPTHLWQARLAPTTKPYPGSHQNNGVEIVPISVLLQTLSAAAAECDASILSDIRFEYPIVVDEPRVIQVVADDESVTVSSSAAADGPARHWVRHVTAESPASWITMRQKAYQTAQQAARALRTPSSPTSRLPRYGARGAVKGARSDGRSAPAGQRPAGCTPKLSCPKPRQLRCSTRPFTSADCGQFQPAVHGSGCRRQCPVRRRPCRPTRPRRGASARRQR